jgi:hypothetical protein
MFNGMSSVEAVQDSHTSDGTTPVTDKTGAEGGVVSTGSVAVTVLLLPERFQESSSAWT